MMHLQLGAVTWTHDFDYLGVFRMGLPGYGLFFSVKSWLSMNLGLGNKPVRANWGEGAEH